ncbi:hypothetical protein ACLOJK_032262 [Asimina triloba]
MEAEATDACSMKKRSLGEGGIGGADPDKMVRWDYYNRDRKVGVGYCASEVEEDKCFWLGMMLQVQLATNGNVVHRVHMVREDSLGLICSR